MVDPNKPAEDAPTFDIQLHVNWMNILKNAWSIRFIVMGMTFSGAEVALPIIDQVVDIPRGTFAALSALATAGAFAARLIAQKNLTPAE